MQKVYIVIDEDYYNRIDDIVVNLKSAGMRIQRILKTLGVVTGDIADTETHKLLLIEGVSNVTSAAIFQIDLPTSEIQ